MINKKTLKYFALFILVLSVITIRIVFVSSSVNDSTQKFTIQKYNTIQSQAVVGKPIKWVKEVSVSEIKKGNHILAVPAIAKDIKIVSSVNNLPASNLEQINRQELSDNSVLISKSKQSVSLAKSLNAGLFSKLSSYISGAGQDMFASVSETIGVSDDSVIEMIPVDITTIATSTVTESQSTSTEEITSDNIQPEEISIESTSTDQISTTTDIVETVISTTKDTVLVSYETPAPTIAEASTDTGKVVTVSAQDTDTQITNVLAYTNIPEIYKVGQEDKIKIKWSNPSTSSGQAITGEQLMTFHAYDLNGNGKLDYVEWIVPHLSTQTFDIIFISKAFQLDNNQNIIADIYDTVATQDGNYSTINNGEYIRATFNSVLNSANDITIYTKPTDSNQPASIEVYPVYTDADGNQTEGPKLTLAPDGINPDFSNINQNGKYRILLSNLQTPTDMFDLKITGSLDVDFVVDPGPGISTNMTISLTTLPTITSSTTLVVTWIFNDPPGTLTSCTNAGFPFAYTTTYFQLGTAGSSILPTSCSIDTTPGSTATETLIYPPGTFTSGKTYPGGTNGLWISGIQRDVIGGTDVGPNPVVVNVHDVYTSSASVQVLNSMTSSNYTLTYIAGSNSTLTGSTTQSVASGGNGTAVTAVPNSGYHFVNWSDASTTNPRTDTNVTGDITVSASFATSSYLLSYVAGTGGSISGSSTQSVLFQSSGTAVTASSSTGYHFVNWSDGVTSTSRTDIATSSNQTFTANFTINTYTLSYTAGSNGTLTGSTTQSVAEGGNGTAVTAVPNSGYHFSSWSDASTTNPRTDTNVTGNISVTANFEANSEDGGGSGGGGIPESSCLGDKCPCDPHGDINKDGKTNLKDFSILMYYWGQTPPTNPCADINEDGTVNLKDFSIMLYWWTN